jgi:hypothetical protein
MDYGRDPKFRDMSCISDTNYKLVESDDGIEKIRPTRASAIATRP